MTCKTGRPVFYLDHLIFSGMKYSTNPEISTATRTNAAHDFPIMISTVTGTVWWVYATKWSRQRAAERAITGARHDAVPAIYEKRRTEILDWKYRELRIWFGQAPLDPWNMPGLEYQYLGFLQFSLLWRSKSWTVTAGGFSGCFVLSMKKARHRSTAPKNAELPCRDAALTSLEKCKAGEAFLPKQNRTSPNEVLLNCVASRL